MPLQLTWNPTLSLLVDRSPGDTTLHQRPWASRPPTPALHRRRALLLPVVPSLPCGRESESKRPMVRVRGSRRALLSCSLVQPQVTSLGPSLALHQQTHVHQNSEESFFHLHSDLRLQTKALGLKLPSVRCRRGCAHPAYPWVTRAPPPHSCFPAPLKESATSGPHGFLQLLLCIHAPLVVFWNIQDLIPAPGQWPTYSSLDHNSIIASEAQAKRHSP